MKRATLTAYSTTPAEQPVDVTDRLLAGQAGQSTTVSAKRQRKTATAKRAGRKRLPAAPEESQSAPAASSLDSALAAVDLASAALRQAGQEAPARYEVALRFRLDALAYHLQQVKEYVTLVKQH